MIRALDAKQHAQRAGARNVVSERSCVVTRAVMRPEDLIRFVAAPDGTLTPDIARKLPGRGVWVSCHKDTVDAAVKSRAFQRSLRRKVSVADDLSDQVDALLIRRVLELLSLCNKAGVVTAGSSKVNSWLEAGAFGALVQANDASPDGLAKIAGKYRAIREATGRPPIEVTLLTISELSLAFGRANVVHAALSEGKAAANVLAAVSRLEKFRATEFEVPTLMGSSGSLEQAPLNRNTG